MYNKILDKLKQGINISTDTRTIKEGDIFLALKGDDFNGHDFLNEASKKGASLLIIDQDNLPIEEYIVPTFKTDNTLKFLGEIAREYKKLFSVQTIAITGSCGKTTTKEILKNILSQAGIILATEANHNNEIGVPKTLLKLTADHKYLIIEMGARKIGDIEYLMKIVDPNVSVITNIGNAHIGVFGGIDKIAQAKGEIFTNLLADNSVAVVNTDDQYAPFLLSLLKDQRAISFGIDRSADITAAYYFEHNNKLSFELITDKGNIAIDLNLSGRHNVLNALAAVAVARSLNISIEDIRTGLMNVQAVQGRLNFIKINENLQLIDDSYNASPTSVKEALYVLSKQHGNKIFVLGDMLELGENSAALHKQIGRIAKNLGIDRVKSYGEFSEYVANGFGLGAYSFKNQEDLISNLMRSLEIEGKVSILIKGSHSTNMKEVVNAIVNERGK